MVAFALLTIGFLLFAGAAAYLLAKGIRTDTWSYDEHHVWENPEVSKYRDK
ncbi:hypothetical protein [Paenibacillus thermotolerans]|uniref:hypothetical protein n=1 Tax=Paenibacillus thermotolerans TaxID=3027807 RepID=UPI00236837AE|nr:MULTISPECIES: hypothetical protein [unclassified Paenibacillus]